MTASIRDQILDKVTAIGDTVPGAAAFRSREAALAREEGPAILVRWADDQAATQMAELTVRDLTVTVTFIARGPIPDQVADPIIVAMHAALYVDQTLGGLCKRIIEGETKPDFEVADQNAVVIVVSYKVRYLTPANSLASST